MPSSVSNFSHAGIFFDGETHVWEEPGKFGKSEMFGDVHDPRGETVVCVIWGIQISLWCRSGPEVTNQMNSCADELSSA